MSLDFPFPRPSRPVAMAGLVLVVGVFDLAGPYLMARRFDWGIPEGIEPAMSGAMAGQAGLLALLAVLGPWRLRVQWPVALLLLVGGIGLIFIGSGIVHYIRNWQEPFRLTLTLPMVFLIAQTPFWALWLFRGVRIVRYSPGDSPATPEMRQTGIRELMMATALVALLLALAKQGLPINPRQSAGPSAQEDGFSLAITGLVWAAGNVVAVLPCLWAAMVARRVSVGLKALAIYTLIASFVPAAIDMFRHHELPAQDLTVYPLIFAIALAVTLYVPLRLARRSGYVVLGLSRTPPAAAEAAAVAVLSDGPPFDDQPGKAAEPEVAS